MISYHLSVHWELEVLEAVLPPETGKMLPTICYLRIVIWIIGWETFWLCHKDASPSSSNLSKANDRANIVCWCWTVCICITGYPRWRNIGIPRNAKSSSTPLSIVDSLTFKVAVARAQITSLQSAAINEITARAGEDLVIGPVVERKRCLFWQRAWAILHWQISIETWIESGRTNYIALQGAMSLLAFRLHMRKLQPSFLQFDIWHVKRIDFDIWCYQKCTWSLQISMHPFESF